MRAEKELLMAKVVANVPELKREPGYLYYIDKQGDVSRVPRAVGHYPGPTGDPEKVVRVGVKRARGRWYCLKGSDVLEIVPKQLKN